MSAIGIMDGAFFVGRKEIVDWVNSTLDLSINKVEDCASGAIACELFDIMYPGTVPMHKVNWSANKDFEYVANYKILQTAFQKNNVDKYIDVDRLITGKYMDNLEFMQWFKRYFEIHNASNSGYDTVGNRAKGKGGNSFFPPKATKQAIPVVRKTNVPPPTKRSSAENKETAKPKPAPAPVKPAPSSTRNSRAPSRVEELRAPERGNDHLHAELEQLKSANEEQEKLISDLRDDVEATEKERDFYFEKLRDIEVLLQGEEDRDDALTKAIFKILYATAEGFEVVPAEDDESEMMA